MVRSYWDTRLHRDEIVGVPIRQLSFPRIIDRHGVDRVFSDFLTRTRVQEIEAEEVVERAGVVFEDRVLGVHGDGGTGGLEDGFDTDEKGFLAGETV